MADGRGGVTNALMAQQPSGFSGMRGGPVSYSNFAPGFTSFAPRPQMAPQAAGGFAPPPNMAGGFAPPPSNMGFTPPAMPGGFTPPPASGLFAPPPAAGAPMPSNAMPARTAQPFRQMFSPGAIANPGGGAMRGRGF